MARVAQSGCASGGARSSAFRAAWSMLGMSLVVAAMMPRAASGTTYTWTGGTSNVWSTAANWGGTVPASGDVGRFVGPSYANQPTIDGAGDTLGGLWNSGTAAVTISPNGAGVLTLTSTTVGGQATTGILVDANAGPLTVNAPVALSAAQSWINNSDYNPLTVNGSVVNGGFLMTLNSSVSSSTFLSGNISGGGGITKSGNGLVILTGSTSFTGPTTVSAGALVLANSAALQGSLVSSVSVNNAYLDFGTLTSLQFSNITGPASSAFTLVNANGAPISLTAGDSTNQVFAGMLNGSAGTLNKVGAGALVLAGTSWGGINFVASQGTLGIASASAGLYSTLTPNGGTVAFAPGGAETFAFGALKGSGNLALADTAGSAITLIVGANLASTTYSGVLSGTGGALVKVGTGTLTLTGANSYTGATNIFAGTLELNYANSPSVLSSTTPSTLAGGTLLLTGHSSGATSQTLGSLAVGAGQSAIVLNSHGGTGVALNVGALAYATQGGALNISPDASSSVTTFTAADSTGIYGGRVVYKGANWATSSGGVIGAYAGYQTLNGSTDVSGSNYQVASNTTLTAAETINSLKIANPAAGQSLDLNNNILNINNGGLLFTGANGFLITDSIGFGAITGGNDPNGSGGLPYDLIIHQYDSVGGTISAIIADNNFNPTALTAAGTGTTYLTAANTYSGPTVLAGGTLSLQNASALGGLSSVTFAGGVLQYGVAGIPDISSKIVNSSGPIAIDTGSQNVTLAGAIQSSNTGGFLKLGSGTLTYIGGNLGNAYVGGTVIAAGTVNLVGAGAATVSDFGVGPITIASGASMSINFKSTGGLTFNNPFFGAGTLVINSTASNDNVTLAGGPNSLNTAGGQSNGSFSGLMVLNNVPGSNAIVEVHDCTWSGGSIQINSNATLFVNYATIASAISVTGSGDGQNFGALRLDYNSTIIAKVTGSVSIVNSATIGSANVDPDVISGNVSGGTMIRIGTGGTIFSGSNTFAALMIGGGEYVLGSSSALPAASPIPLSFAQYITGGAGNVRALDLNGYNATISDLSSSITAGSSNIRNQTWYANGAGYGNNVPATLTIANAANDTYSGTITNGAVTSAAALSITKANVGDLFLSGNNSYTGTTSINGGTLTVASANALGSSSTITFGGGTLQYTSGGTGDYSAFIKNSASAITIDTNGQTVNYNSPIAASNTAGLTKLGAGLLSLGTAGTSVANSYTGLTSVTAGSLAVYGSLASTGSVNVAPLAVFMLGGSNAGSVGATVVQTGAAIDFTKLTNAGSYSFSSLSLAASSSLNTSNNPSLAPFAGAALLSLTGSNSITINFPTATALTAGTYGLISYGGGTIGGDGNDVGDLKIGANDIIGSGKFVSTGSVIDLVVTAPVTTWTWNGTGSDWVSANAWTASGGTTTETFQSGDLEVLKDTAGTGSAVLNGSIALNTSNVTPGSVTFSNTAVPYVISGSFGIAGPTSVTIDGGGAVSLATSNIYTGGTTLVSGLLNVDNASAIGSGTLTIGGGTLGNDTGSPIALTTNNLQVWQAGSFVFQGPYSLNLGDGAVAMTGSTTINITAGSLTVGGPISGPGSLTQNGAGTLILSGSNVYLGDTIVKGGTLQIGSGGASGTFGAGPVTDNGTIVFSRSDSGLAVANNISGSGSVNQAGSGLLTLSGSNTYANGTFVSAGSLQVSSTFSLPNYTSPGAGSVSNGAGLILGVGGSNQFQSADVGSVLSNIAFNGNSYLGLDTTAAPAPVTLSANITAPPTLGVVKLGPGTLIVNGSNTYGGGMTVAGGVLQLGTSNTLAGETVTVLASSGLAFTSGIGSFTIGGLSGTGGFSLADTSSLPVFLQVGANNANTTFSGSIGGSGTLDKTGAGILTLTAAGSYIGGTTVNSGTLTITNAGALGSGLTTINANGTVNVVRINQITAAFAGSGTINSEPSNGQETDFRGLAGFTGMLNAISGGGSSKTDIRNTVMSGGTINIASGATLFCQSDVIAASIFVSGTGNSEKFGALRIDGDTVSGGSISSVVLNGPVTLLGNTTIGNQGGAFTSSTIAAPIGQSGGSFGITQRGNGTIILASSNTYTGGTTIASGVLQLGDSNAVALSTVTVNAANGLAFSPGIGTFNVGGLAGSANFSLFDTNTNPVTVAVGGDDQSTAFTGAIGGGGSLIKNGTGMLTLDGVNTYLGGTQVAGGILQLGNNSALGSGALAADGGTLDMAGYSITVPSFSGASGVVTSSLVGSSGTLTVNQSSATSFGGAVDDGAGQVALLLSAGTLTLTGTNTYSGGTTVTDGELILTNNAAIEDGTNLFIGSDLSAFGTVVPAQASNVIAAPGVAPVPEPSTLVLLATASLVVLLRRRRR